VLLFVVLILSGGVLVVSLGRRLAREREMAERAESKRRGFEAELSTKRHELRGAVEKVDILETEREARSRVVEGELVTLRRDLAAAVRERDDLADRYRAAVSERDRTAEQFLAARRTLEQSRTDLVKAGGRAEEAETAAERAGRAASEAERRLDESNGRVAALLRPLLQDLRSADGSLRVRAHEALCAFAGENLVFRTNGTPEEIAADARAIEARLLP
jgi:chromosome segregation ATPase